MKLSFIRQDRSTLEFVEKTQEPTPNLATYGVVKLDYDQQWPSSVVEKPNLRFRVSRPTRNSAARKTKGLPATARFKDDRTVVLTKDLQEWIHKLCWDKAPGMSEKEAKNAWRSLMADDRYTTNYAGSQTRADYVNGTRLSERPIELQPMTTGGAILKILREQRYFGEDCYVFEAINSLGDYRQYNPTDHPHLFYRPSNSVRVEINDSRGRWTGTWRENKSDPFPQYLGQAIIPIFGVGQSENYLPKWRVRILQQGEAWPSPFVA